MKYESGRSMIEMLGVLAIMGVITVGAISMISMAMRTQKRTAVNDDVVQMVTGVRQLLGEYDDFSHIDNSTIFDAIGVKNKNPFGGVYELSVDPSNSHQFVVTITGLGQADCQALVTKAWADSVGYQMSGGQNGGATGRCTDADGKNFIKIVYGD